MSTIIIIIMAAITLMTPQLVTSIDTIEPLIFEQSGNKAKIHWNPLINISRVIMLANRDVHYRRSTINNDTNGGGIEEYVGEWRVMVAESDNDDGHSKRYVFIKTAACNEIDWQIQWIDANNQTYGPITVRMPSAPTDDDWRPTIDWHVGTPTYDANRDRLIIDCDWEMRDAKLDNAIVFEEFEPVIEVHKCGHLLKRPVPPMRYDVNAKRFEMSADYGRAKCSFYVRLSALTENEEYECRNAYRTADDVSSLVNVSCESSIAALACPSASGWLACHLHCSSPIEWTRIDNSNNGGGPLIDISWQLTPSVADAATQTLVRTVQIDNTYNNYAIREFNASVYRLAPNERSHLTLVPYTNRDMDASYGVQVCAVLEQCDAIGSIDWTQIDQTSIFFNRPQTARQQSSTTTHIMTSMATTTITTTTTTKHVPMSNKFSRKPKFELQNAVISSKCDRQQFNYLTLVVVFLTFLSSLFDRI